MFYVMISLAFVIAFAAIAVCIVLDYKRHKNIEKRLKCLTYAFASLEERVWSNIEIKCPVCGEIMEDCFSHKNSHYENDQANLFMNPRGNHFKCQNHHCPEYGETKWLEKIIEERKIRAVNYQNEQKKG